MGVTTQTEDIWARQVWAEPHEDRHVRSMLLRSAPLSVGESLVVVALGIVAALVLVLAGIGAWTVVGWVTGG